MEENQVQVNIDPLIQYATNVNILFSEEDFLLALQSGNHLVRFAFSPKHAKRVLLLLENKIAEYEKLHGVIVTELPKTKSETTKPEVGFRS